MSASHPKSTYQSNMFEYRTRGFFPGMATELRSSGICIEWTRFSLKELCDFQFQWDQEIIGIYYNLCKYYAFKTNTNIPFSFDLDPSHLTDAQLNNNPARFNGDCDVVTIFQFGDHTSGHYVLLKIKHTTNCAFLYDSAYVQGNRIDASWKKKIFAYLKRNNFVNGSC